MVANIAQALAAAEPPCQATTSPPTCAAYTGPARRPRPGQRGRQLDALCQQEAGHQPRRLRLLRRPLRPRLRRLDHPQLRHARPSCRPPTSTDLVAAIEAQGVKAIFSETLAAAQDGRGHRRARPGVKVVAGRRTRSTATRLGPAGSDGATYLDDGGATTPGSSSTTSGAGADPCACSTDDPVGSPALVLDHVAVAYDGVPPSRASPARWGRAQSLALIGPNGSGKSTLLKAILGLVPLQRAASQVLGTTPASGRGGRSPTSRSRRRSTPSSRSSVRQVVLMGRYRRVGWVRRPGRADRAVAAAALERVGLDRPGRRPVRHAVGRPAPAGADRPGHRPGGPRCCCSTSRSTGSTAPPRSCCSACWPSCGATGVAVVMSTHDLAVAHVRLRRGVRAQPPPGRVRPDRRRPHARPPAPGLRRPTRWRWSGDGAIVAHEH